jgi:N6-L-threonylcarbamoyladenine synthase
MIVLGIESTCDETGCAIVRDGREILSNIVSSQAELHNQLGGVMPELACRQHVEMLIPVIEQALSEAQITLNQVDVIAVAHCPGLIGALLLGVTTAKALAMALKKPLVGINHTEAHLYAALMSHPTPPTYPCLGAVLSGGHTAVLEMKEIGSYRLIGHTVDDAIGEAYDKVAKMLGLPYPGGPHIEKWALSGNPHAFSFKAGHVKSNPFDFSFSGLKTAVLYTIKDREMSDQLKHDVAASFQHAALSDIILKLKRAAESTGAKSIVFGGGVTNNRKIREMAALAFPHLQLIWPSFDLTLDNAAMIAGLGYEKYRQNPESNLFLEAVPTFSWIAN